MSTYITLPFIEQTGNSYLNTGVAITSGSIRVELQYSFTEIGNSEANLFGTFYDWPNNSGLIAFGTNDSRQIRSVVSQGNSFRYAIGTTPAVGTVYTAEVNIDSGGQNLLINGDTYTGDGYAVGTQELFIFCNGAELAHFAKARLYYLKIYDGNTLIRDYVPSLEYETAIGGLYDNITNSFIGNAGITYNSWSVSETEIQNILVPTLPDLFDSLPDALWRTEDNNLFNKLMPQNTYLGAFANATQLRRISIPKSCKKIGRYSFRNTKLTSVTIASDCVYYDTSFPAGCVVNFYPD